MTEAASFSFNWFLKCLQRLTIRPSDRSEVVETLPVHHPRGQQRMVPHCDDSPSASQRFVVVQAAQRRRCSQLSGLQLQGHGGLLSPQTVQLPGLQWLNRPNSSSIERRPVSKPSVNPRVVVLHGSAATLRRPKPVCTASQSVSRAAASDREDRRTEDS